MPTALDTRRRTTGTPTAGGRGLALAAVGTALGLALGYAWRRRIADRPPPRHPAGRPMGGMVSMLAAGSHLLQGSWPLDGFDIYLVGFHPAKDHPDHQMEAHHFCRQVNEDFAECALFDGNTADANLIGIEYIVSERLYEELPEAERTFWHPHNGEILSGQLIAPGLPRVAEHALMAHKMNSYGKTWHVWDTGGGTRSGHPLPYGAPMLMWSFSRLGEAREWLIRQRDARFGVDTDVVARSRADLVRLARPQAGVDAMKGRFGSPTRDIPGVRDRRDRLPP